MKNDSKWLQCWWRNSWSVCEQRQNCTVWLRTLIAYLSYLGHLFHSLYVHSSIWRAEELSSSDHQRSLQLDSHSPLARSSSLLQWIHYWPRAMPIAHDMYIAQSWGIAPLLGITWWDLPAAVQIRQEIQLDIPSRNPGWSCPIDAGAWCRAVWSYSHSSDEGRIDVMLEASCLLHSRWLSRGDRILEH